MKIIKFGLMPFLIIPLLLGMFNCGGDPPSGPITPDTEYMLYFWDSMKSALISIDVQTEEMVDSVSFDDYIGAMSVSSGGDRLTMNTTTGQSIYKASNLDFLTIIDQHGFYYFDGKDNYAIWAGLSGINFVNPVNLVPEDSVGSRSFFCYLDTVNNLFLFHGSENRGNIYMVDCIKREIIDSIKINGPSISEFVYIKKYNDIYFHGGGGGGKYIMQYDVDSDSILNHIWISSYVGGIAHTPDFERVIASDGGNGLHNILSPGKIYIIETATGEIESELSVRDDSGYFEISPYFGYNLIVTPDGKKAFLGGQPGCYGDLVVLDLVNNEIVGKIEPYYNATPTCLAFGPKTK